MRSVRSLHGSASAFLAVAVCNGAGCNGDTLYLGIDDGALELSPREVLVGRDGKAVELAVSITPARALSDIDCHAPAGIECRSNKPGTLTLRASRDALPGVDSEVVVEARVGGRQLANRLTVTVADVVKVFDEVDPSQGVGGKLRQYLSTSFQPADWQYRFFENHPEEKDPDTSRLAALAPQHILVQVMDGGAIPWDPTTGEWRFDKLDAIVEPLLGIADRSPELQIAVPPGRVGSVYDLTGPALASFEQYCRNLVSYYNGEGFSAGNETIGPLSSADTRRPITWWGILSDPNLHGMKGNEYADVYNTVGRAMRAVDPGIRLSALEWGDTNSTEEDIREWLTKFFEKVEVPVDALSFHIYGATSTEETDQAIFDKVPFHAEHVRLMRQELAKSPGLADVPVRITQNNVNADAPTPDGKSTNRKHSPFENDLRGTSWFFAAYRPYLYSQLAKAGSGALYHWLYTAGTCETQSDHCSMDGGVNTDPQNSEFDYRTGSPYKSYWVDSTLRQAFPVIDGAPDEALDDLMRLGFDGDAPTDGGEIPPTDPAGVEVLAAKRPDGSLVIMVVDHAVEYPEDTESHRADKNGRGAPRTVVLDLSDFPSSLRLAEAQVTTLDAEHNFELSEPPPSSNADRIALAGDRRLLRVSLAGYGVAFVHVPWRRE